MMDPSIIEQKTHPPYALMIQQAVKGLNEENGSTKEAISGFITREFQDLPVIHSSILGLHLKKLCEEGEIFCHDSGRYVIVDDCGDGRPCEINDKVCKGTGRKERDIQEANVEMNDNINMGEKINTEPCMGEKQDSLVIFSHIPCENQPNNMTGGETLEMTGGAESCNELQEHMAKQPYNLLVEAENQSLQIEATNEMSRFCSDEIRNNDYLSGLPGNPIDSYFPKEEFQFQIYNKLQDPNFIYRIYDLVYPEDAESTTETLCSPLPTEPDIIPVDVTSNFQPSMPAPSSHVSCEHIQSEGKKLTPTQLQVQASCEDVETDLHTTTKILDSMTTHAHKQPQDDLLGSPKCRVEKNTTHVDMETHMPMPPCIGLQPMEKPFANDREVSLLPSDGGINVELELRLAWENLMNRKPDTSSTIQLQFDDPAAYKAQVELDLRLAWENLMNSGSATTCKAADSSSLNGSQVKTKQHGNKVGLKLKQKLHAYRGKENAHPNHQKLPRKSGSGKRPLLVPTTQDFSPSCVPVESSNNGNHSEQNPSLHNGIHSEQKPSLYNGSHSEQKPSIYNGIHSEQNPSFSNGNHSEEKPSFYNGFLSLPQDSLWSWMYK